MLSQEENDFFTRVGPGTPAGELLRRYWQPVGVAAELTDDNPTKFVRLLGEDLVLCRDKSGRVGLLGDHCPHRGASLLYGRVEERGIACAYHGWLYDVQGNCLETPAEPADSRFYLTVKHRAYPVQKFAGLYWAYLGPEPVPLIPRYDVWARTDGRRWIEVLPQLDCNWFQVMENSADPAHLLILHQGNGPYTSAASSTRGLVEPLERFEVWEVPYGLMKKRIFKDGRNESEHPLIFPNILRVQNCTEIRVPIDDTHTNHIRIYFELNPGGGLADGEDPPVEYCEPFKTPTDALHPAARFHKWYEPPVRNPVEDYMAWETQGPISNRTAEHLATSDHGIAVLRDMMRREIDRMQQGLDPMGVIRDPDHPVIDTNLTTSLRPGRRVTA